MDIDPESLPYRPCVGVVLMNADGHVFVGERIDTPGAWQMPQGGVDAGETPQEAGVRELWEETGVTADKVDLIAQTSDWLTYDLPPELLGKVWKGKYRGQKQKWLLLRFNGNDADIRIDTDHPEFARWKWVKGSELVAGIVPFKRHIYEAVVAEFKDHLS